MRSFLLLRSLLGEVIKIESCLVSVALGVAGVVGGLVAVGALAMLL